MSQGKEVSLNSPWIKRFMAWAQERFPIDNVISGCFVFVTLIIVARHLENSLSIKLLLTDLGGCLAVTCQFLLLRIWDEHKDYEQDLLNYPERALQKGLITLAHLRVIGVISFLVTLLWTLFIGSEKSIILWLVMMIYTVLMGKEFFMGKFLEKRVVLYSFLHQLISPFMIIWVLSMGTTNVFSVPIYYILALSSISGLIYEVTRKTRGVEEEKATLDSYTKIWGLRGCVLIISIFTILMNVCFILFLDKFHTLNAIDWGLIVFFEVIFIGSLINYLKDPTLKTRKKNEGAFGLQMSMIYILLIYKVMSVVSVKWSLF
jgi:hypothetical protein